MKITVAQLLYGAEDAEKAVGSVGREVVAILRLEKALCYVGAGILERLDEQNSLTEKRNSLAMRSANYAQVTLAQLKRIADSLETEDEAEDSQAGED